MTWIEHRELAYTLLCKKDPTAHPGDRGAILMVGPGGQIYELNELPKGKTVPGKKKLIGQLQQSEFMDLVANGIDYCSPLIQTTLDNLIGLEKEAQGEKLPKKYARFADVVVKAEDITIKDENPLGQGLRHTIKVTTHDKHAGNIMRSYFTGSQRHDLQVTVMGKLVLFPKSRVVMVESSDNGTDISYYTESTMTVLGDAHHKPPQPSMKIDEYGIDGPRKLDL